jgi:folate-binding protein YgfZ
MEPLALHALHEALGARFDVLEGRELVRAYGPLEQEYQAARQGCAIADLSAREWVRLRGPDRTSFLHGMVTQDIKGMPERGVAYAAMLTAKGAMVADARVWRRQDALLLELEPGYGGKAREFLEKYLISEDAELADASADWTLLTLLGAKARETAARAGFDATGTSLHSYVTVQDVSITASTWAPTEGLDLLVTRAQVQSVFQRLVDAGATPVGFDTLEVIRVESGTPRYGQDMHEKTIPLEANLERALHYNKGCYIGQEVIARATFRGHVNRKLAGLVLPSPPPERMAELRSGDRRVGWITSVVTSPARPEPIALAYVHRDFLAPGTLLEIAGTDQKATVHALPFTAP